MSNGLGILAVILASELTLTICSLIFIFFAGLLLVRWKKLKKHVKAIAIAALAVTGAYLGFIGFLMIMWGR